MSETLKQLLQSTMQIELNGLIKAAPYQITKFELLYNLEVPRPRKGRLPTKVFKRYQRRWQEVNQFIRDTLIAGVSSSEAGLVRCHKKK